MLSGSIMFPGTSDIEQLSLIFDIMGTPVIEDWPEAEFLPCYLPFSDQPAKELQEVIVAKRIENHGDKDVDTELVKLVKMMLELNPAKRITAKAALEIIS